MNETHLREDGKPVANLVTIFEIEVGKLVRTNEGAYLVKSIKPGYLPRSKNPWGREHFVAEVTAVGPEKLDPLPKKEFRPLPSGHWKLQAESRRGLRE